jgi:ring-1,2-phenylacetyl-CoA epoxidase subunit PaaD
MKHSGTQRITSDDVREWLREVKDPEIPVLSLVDLGVITRIDVNPGGVRIEMTPTFVGCPALDYMKREIREVLLRKGVDCVEVDVNFKQPWTSDRISESGRRALQEYGLAPPPLTQLFTDLEVLEHAVCPRCGHNHTELRNMFGPTLCRSIYYCNDCKEAFEQFKQV